MCRRIAMAALLLCFSVAVAGAADANPLTHASLGDWAAYKIANKAGGFSVEKETKYTVTRKTDAAVTIEIAREVGGQEATTSFTVDLAKKFDPRLLPFADKGEMTIKELDKGEDTLTVAGKTLKAAWSTFEAAGTHNGRPIALQGKSWLAPDVPLGGLVKLETESATGKRTMELKAFGTK
ncbi:MAG: hypothetical protein NTW87_35150 [Planctomycetota bacterium]|nr:hypothetical protein [Planctomycetota bacterium]